MYRKGYRAELEVIEIFEKYYSCKCIRSAGSKGVADLICGNGTDVYVIQVKYGDKDPTVNESELIEYASNFKGSSVIAHRRKRGEWNLRFL